MFIDVKYTHLEKNHAELLKTKPENWIQLHIFVVLVYIKINLFLCRR